MVTHKIDYCLQTQEPTDPGKLIVRLVKTLFVEVLQTLEWGAVLAYTNDFDDRQAARIENPSVKSLEAWIRAHEKERSVPSASRAYAISCGKNILLGESTDYDSATISTFGREFAVESRSVCEMNCDAEITNEFLNPALVSMFVEPPKSGELAVQTKNAERLLSLLNELITRFTPESVKVFCDYDLRIPLNASCSYFTSSSTMATELRFLADFIENGLAAYGIPPAREWSEDQAEVFLHICRSEPDLLRQRAMQAVEIWRHATATIVERTLGEFQRADGSFLISTRTPPLGGFISEQYLQVSKLHQSLR